MTRFDAPCTKEYRMGAIPGDLVMEEPAIEEVIRRVYADGLGIPASARADL